MKVERKGKAVDEWREEIIRRCRGSRVLRFPVEGEVPRTPVEPRSAPKEVVSRFFQLASGHAMTAPFIKEKFGWIESDICWWCGSAR